jgi:hypothetical protein
MNNVSFGIEIPRQTPSLLAAAVAAFATAILAAFAALIAVALLAASTRFAVANLAATTGRSVGVFRGAARRGHSETAGG